MTYVGTRVYRRLKRIGMGDALYSRHQEGSRQRQRQVEDGREEDEREIKEKKLPQAGD